MNQPLALPELQMHIDLLSTADKFVLLEHLAHSLRTAHHEAGSLPWTEFLDLTYGSMAEDPIERAPQGTYEERESLP